MKNSLPFWMGGMTVLILGLAAGALWVGGAVLAMAGIRNAPRGFEGKKRFHFGERSPGRAKETADPDRRA